MECDRMYLPPLCNQIKLFKMFKENGKILEINV